MKPSPAAWCPTSTSSARKTGLGEDRRWQKVGADYFQWTARHDAHLTPRRSIANIGVVIGQSTQLLYPGPKTAHSRAYMHETTQGIYEALLRGRFAFDFVHEDRLEPERLAKYRALLLPNVAMLSDRQCDQLREYVAAGGSLMASFETSLYDENLTPRADFGLADLFGVSKAGDAIGTNGNPYYARIAESPIRQHPILNGFTAQIGFPARKIASRSNPFRIPCSPSFPASCAIPRSWPIRRISHTQEPAVVLRESGTSRTAWFAGDVERTYWLTGHGDLLRLLHNTIRWLTHDEAVVHVDGPGFIEMFCWETRPGYAVHLLNYTNPNAHHGWLRSVYPLGAQNVSMKLPTGVKVRSVELLHGETTVPFTIQGGVLHFTVPRVDDSEVAAITV